jgi:hypothetical protein
VLPPFQLTLHPPLTLVKGLLQALWLYRSMEGVSVHYGSEHWSKLLSPVQEVEKAGVIASPQGGWLARPHMEVVYPWRGGWADRSGQHQLEFSPWFFSLSVLFCSLGCSKSLIQSGVETTVRDRGGEFRLQIADCRLTIGREDASQIRLSNRQSPILGRWS